MLPVSHSERRDERVWRAEQVLDASEHCDRGFHLGEDVSCLHFQLPNLAALVYIVGIREASLDYEDSSKADLCQLLCFMAMVVEVACLFKISTSNQY